MKRIVLTLLAAVAVVAAIGPASAQARGKAIVPTPGNYAGKTDARGARKVTFQLTAKDKIVDFTDGSDVTAAKPKPVFTVHRDDPNQFPDDPISTWFQECDQFCIWGWWTSPTEVVGKYYLPGRQNENLDFEAHLEAASPK
jgi:hypothetical protein